ASRPYSYKLQTTNYKPLTTNYQLPAAFAPNQRGERLVLVVAGQAFSGVQVGIPDLAGHRARGRHGNQELRQLVAAHAVGRSQYFPQRVGADVGLLDDR